MNLLEQALGITDMTENIDNSNNEILLSIQDLKVWFELRRFGFGISGHVHAVDGVSFDLWRERLWKIQFNEDHPGYQSPHQWSGDF
jgi:ABC-type glutathione transport system ATPase component